MGPETGHLKRPELPARKEKLDFLWQKAWELMKREGDFLGEDRLLIRKEGRLIEIETSWNADFNYVEGVSVKTFLLPPEPKGMINPEIMSPEAEICVYNPEVSVHDYRDSQVWEFDGKVNTDLVEGISFSLCQLLGEI